MEATATAATTVVPGERLLRLPEVAERVGLEKTAIYALMKRGDFPQCIKLSWRTTAWVASEVDDWIAQRIRDSVRGARTQRGTR